MTSDPTRFADRNVHGRRKDRADHEGTLQDTPHGDDWRLRSSPSLGERPSGEGVALNIGVISDTHGLLRPEAAKALQHCDLILHAGDVGSQQVLDALGELAPVIAVRGNCDEGDWAQRLEAVQIVTLAALSIYLIHDLKDIDPGAAAGCRVVISGHTHKPRSEAIEGVLYLNPGSAGRRRFKLPITLARLAVDRDRVSAEVIHLAASGD